IDVSATIDGEDNSGAAQVVSAATTRNGILLWSGSISSSDPQDSSVGVPTGLTSDSAAFQGAGGGSTWGMSYGSGHQASTPQSYSKDAGNNPNLDRWMGALANVQESVAA